MLVKRILFMSLFLLTSCHAELMGPPTLTQPVELERTFFSSFDKTWDAVIEVVNVSRGSMIVEDKSSGLIVFTLSEKIYGHPYIPSYYSEADIIATWSKVIVTIYMKGNVTENSTTVYLYPRVRFGLLWIRTAKEFFQKLRERIGNKSQE